MDGREALKSGPIFAGVLTGDVVDSTKVAEDARSELLAALKRGFEAYKEGVLAPFQIWRGDGLQGVVEPWTALRHALVIRLSVKSLAGSVLPKTADVRIAIGIGEVRAIPEGNAAEGGGDAFLYSGRRLDRMQSHSVERLRVVSDQATLFDGKFNLALALLDDLIAKWSVYQAEAVLLALHPSFTQEAASSELDISRTSLRDRLDAAGWHSIQLLLDEFEKDARTYWRTRDAGGL